MMTPEHALKSLSKRANLFQDGLGDSGAYLTPEKRQGWAKFLLSIATTESVENLLMEPLVGFFKKDSDISTYLAAHAEDERRHFRVLTEYVLRSFGMTKKTRSLSDRVIYDTLLPGVGRAIATRPYCSLGMLYFFEIFSVDFYDILKKKSRKDGLIHLLKIFQGIEKDERRHLAGLRALSELLVLRVGPPSRGDLAWLRWILRLFQADIHVGRFAIHNRKVRKSAQAIGVDPAWMNQNAKNSARNSLEFIRRIR